MKATEVSGTAMAAAFAAAGFEPPEKRLRRLMREAMVEHVGIEARVLAVFERRLRDDPALMFALVGTELLRNLVLRLFHEIRNEIRLEQSTRKPSGGGQRNTAGDAGRLQRAAPAPPSPQREAETGASGNPGHAGGASPAAKPAYTPSPAMRTLANGLLATFRIEGRPIGECTAGEARAWARNQGIKARFVERLCNGLADTMRIGEFRTEAEAADEYEAATREAK